MAETISLIDPLWKMLEGIVKGYVSQKSDVFENHIEPLMEKVILIHKDYIESFTEFKIHLQERTKPTNELLDFLQQHRRDYAYLRQLAVDLGEKITSIRKIVLNKEDSKAIELFSVAIIEYFTASTEVGVYSWYSDLLETVRWQSKYDSKIIPDVWKTTTITGYDPDILLEIVDNMLNQGLPNSFKKVSEAYANLRVRLL